MLVTTAEVASQAGKVAELAAVMAPTARRIARLADELAVEAKEYAARAEKSAQGKVALLDLPPELRIVIYKLVLTDEKHPGQIVLHSYRGRCHIVQRQSYKHGSTLYSLLLVNSQIHQEATPVLYGTNEIIWNASLRPRQIYWFLDSIDDNVRHLQCCSIVLDFERSSGSPALEGVVEMLCKAPRFNHLTIIIKGSLDLLPCDDDEYIYELADTLEPLVAHVLARKTGKTGGTSINSIIRLKQGKSHLSLNENEHFDEFVESFHDMMIDLLMPRMTLSKPKQSSHDKA